MRWQLPVLIKLTIRASAVAHWPAVGPGMRYPNKVEERPFGKAQTESINYVISRNLSVRNFIRSVGFFFFY